MQKICQNNNHRSALYRIRVEESPPHTKPEELWRQDFFAALRVYQARQKSRFECWSKRETWEGTRVFPTLQVAGDGTQAFRIIETLPRLTSPKTLSAKTLYPHRLPNSEGSFECWEILLRVQKLGMEKIRVPFLLLAKANSVVSPK